MKTLPLSRLQKRLLVALATVLAFVMVRNASDVFTDHAPRGHGDHAAVAPHPHGPPHHHAHPPHPPGPPPPPPAPPAPPSFRS